MLCGIMAVADDDIVVNTPDYVFKFDTTGRGWITCCSGAFAVLEGFLSSARVRPTSHATRALSPHSGRWAR